MQSYSRIGRKQVLFFLNFIISAIDRVLFLGPNGGQGGWFLCRYELAQPKPGHFDQIECLFCLNLSSPNQGKAGKPKGRIPLIIYYGTYYNSPKTFV